MPNNYKFTSPIRYFKANDPYYYEVDNIPLRQLEENILHLKNSIETTIGGSSPNKGTINLSDIKDLKAFHKEGRTIAVNPGKFIARVNSLNKARAKIFSKVQLNNGQYLETILASVYNDIFNSVIGAAGFSPLGFNGLETMNGFYLHAGGEPMQFDSTSPDGVPKYAGVTSVAQYSNKIGFPILNGHGISNLLAINANPVDKFNLAELNRNFVQQWGGVFRTSLVSVDSELSIEIPVIAENELFVREIDGTSTNHAVSQRIDLLVIYTVPVDSTETTIVDYSDTAVTPAAGSPAQITPIAKTILSPQLGIVRGAGIGLRKTSPGANEVAPFIVDNVVSPGKPKILAVKADKGDNIIAQASLVGVKVGGTTVRGSFPSPDDLLNLAPALVASALEFFPGQDGFQNYIPNIGQTVLPIAYVVVNNDESTLTQTNIVDIRPFFRTTELTYNERAGIAAASPPLSFANPVASKWDIDKIKEEVIASIGEVTRYYPLMAPKRLFFYSTNNAVSGYPAFVSDNRTLNTLAENIPLFGEVDIPTLASFLNIPDLIGAKTISIETVMHTKGNYDVLRAAFTLFLAGPIPNTGGVPGNITKMFVGCAGGGWEHENGNEFIDSGNIVLPILDNKFCYAFINTSQWFLTSNMSFSNNDRIAYVESKITGYTK